MQTKTQVTTLKSVVFIGAIALSNLAFAADCDTNFETKGSLLTGQSYSTTAGLSGVSEGVAYQSVQQAMVAEGWKITSTEPEKGIISALNGASTRPAPLTVIVQKAPMGSSRIGMLYTNPAGAMSPEAAIKAQFCKLIAAAGSAPVVGAAAPVAQVARTVFTGNPNLAALSDAQAAKLDTALNKPLQDAKMNGMVAEAKPIIRDVIGKLACLKDFDTTTFSRYVAPNSNQYHYAHGPASSTQYHNKSICLTVEKFRDWSALALNAFKFEVVFLAEDSGESVNRKYKLIKQPDGEWLFNMIKGEY